MIFPEDDRARFSGGQVAFTQTKTDTPRTVPLHPEAEAALRSIMPDDPASDAYIFPRRGKPGEPWKRTSYRKAWIATLEAVSEEHPRLKGMWGRDWRKAAIIDMRAAGTDGTIAGKLAGHSTQMSNHYTQARDQHTRAAVALLGQKKTASRVLGRVLRSSQRTKDDNARATVN